MHGMSSQRLALKLKEKSGSISALTWEWPDWVVSMLGAAPVPDTEGSADAGGVADWRYIGALPECPVSTKQIGYCRYKHYGNCRTDRLRENVCLQ